MNLNKPILIVIEGHDRTGKDTLLNKLKEDNRVLICKQQTHEETGTDCRNKEEYEKWVFNHVNTQLDEYIKLGKTNNILICTRLWMSDNVFSDVFGRSHVVYDNLYNKIYDNFDVRHYVILWDSYDEYKKRLSLLHEDLEYNKYEFDKIRDLYLKYSSINDKIMLIDNNTSKELIYSNFVNNVLRYGME